MALKRSLTARIRRRGGGEPAPFDAFISYSRRDTDFVAALENSLERYKPPKGVQAEARHLRVFRDEEDLVGGEYSGAIDQYVGDSAKLIVVCSPSSRASEFVGDEIRRFVTAKGPAGVIPLLIAGVPNNEADGPDDPRRAFPEALCELLEMPLATPFLDFDPKRDHFDREPHRRSWFKLLAQLLDMSQAEIEQREEHRERRRRRLWQGLTAVFVAISAVALWQWVVAERETRIATSRQLAASAVNALDRDPLLGVSLALEAVRTRETDEAEVALRRALNASRERHQLLTPDAEVRAVAFDPTGERLAVGADDGVVRIWRTGSDTSPTSLVHRARVNAVAFTPDGTRVVTAAGDGTARVWDAESGSLLHTLAEHGAEVRDLSLDPSGRLVVTASWDGTARLWDVVTGEAIGGSWLHGSRLSGVVFSPRGDRVATAPSDGTVRLWDPASGTQTHALQGHDDRVVALAFSPDGARLASGGWDGTVRVWDVQSGALLATGRGHTDRVVSVAFNSDGTLVASASYDRTARLWDGSSGEPVTTLVGHGFRLSAVHFSPDGSTVATASDDGTAILWSADRHFEAAKLVGHTAEVTTLSFSSDGARVASGSADGTARVWDALASGESALLGPMPDRPDLLAFDRSDGMALLAVGGSSLGRRRLGDPSGAGARAEAGIADLGDFVELEGDALAISQGWTGLVLLIAGESGGRIVDGRSGEVLSALEHPIAFASGALSPSGRYAATIDEAGAARVWASESGRSILAVPADHGEVIAVDLARGDSLVATAHADTTAVVWDLRSGEPMAVLRGHTDELRLVRFGPDGVRLATGSSDRTARVWDAGTGRLVAELGGHVDRLLLVVFSQDGRGVVTSGSDRVVRLWELDEGVDPSGAARLVATLRGHLERVVAAEYSPDGSHLITASWDGTAKLWLRATGAELASFGGHADRLTAARFAPDGSFLVTAARDRWVRIWPYELSRLIEQSGRTR